MSQTNIAVTKFEDINKLKPREIFEMQQITNIFEKCYGKDFKHILEREKVFALQVISANKDLAVCEPFSIYTSIINLSVCKLTLNPAMNQATLIPYNINTGTKDKPVWTKKAQLSIMYQGKIDILTGVGAIKYIKSCEVVFDCDDFEMNMGIVKKHVPELAQEGKIIGGYVIAIMPDGKERHLFMRESQFVSRREKAKSKTFWEAWPEEMRKKTLINQLYKTLPKTTSFPAVAKAFDDMEEQIVTTDVPHEVVQESVVVEEEMPTNEAEPNTIGVEATVAVEEKKEDTKKTLQEQADSELPF